MPDDDTPDPVTGSPMLPVGAGTGRLSADARRRLARPAATPIHPPPAGDRRAVAAWRARVHAAWQAGDPSAADCDHDEVTVAGIRCLRAGGPGPLLVYFHGGGYALGSPEVALPITERLARWAEVVSVDYRLAPEHPHPAAIDDARAVVHELARSEPGRVLAVGGDSAGGNLALTVALDPVPGRDRSGAPTPAGVVLFSPHLDHGAPDTVPDGAARSPLDDVDQPAADWLRDAYCGPTPPTDPAVSPLRADLRRLPPTLVQVGTRDSLLDHGVRLARAARLVDAGPVTLDVWSGLWHTWHYHRGLPEADRALEEAGRFLASLGP